AAQRTVVTPPPAPAPRTAAGSGGTKVGKAVAAERQLLEIVLADPGLVPKAMVALTPEELTHSGLRRMLTELYSAQTSGAVPDVDALRERLTDRPDLFDAALKLQFAGQFMQERERWLTRLLKCFADLKAEAEQRLLKEQLAGASDEQAIELLRRLQQAHEKKK